MHSTFGYLKLGKIFATILVVLSTTTVLETHAQDEGWGHFTGQIIVEGEVPKADDLVVDKDMATCLRDQPNIPDPSLIVGEEGGLKDAFVMMYLSRRDPKPDVHESYDETADAKFVLDNKSCSFEPYAMFLRTSQTLTMKNSDDVGHNCHVSLFKNEANVNLPAGEEVDVKLTEVEKVPGPVKCDIHGWMDAVLLVRDEPYAAITGEDGKFKIENLPEGTWKFQFWHKRKGYLKSLEKDGEKFLGQRLGEIEITIKSGETMDLGKLTINIDDLKK